MLLGKEADEVFRHTLNTLQLHKRSSDWPRLYSDKNGQPLLMVVSFITPGSVLRRLGAVFPGSDGGLV